MTTDFGKYTIEIEADAAKLLAGQASADTALKQIENSVKKTAKEGANKQVISSQADSLIKISRIWADFFPANTSNQPI
ncbi:MULTISPECIES: hypothetical protein [Klebsiella]|uniref:hypothetical protein n=1 Tax=Klebsiella TaxID=570 RepID=UPI0025918999|nr:MULTISPECIES: hypothetical protein [Klebsiella]MDM4471109.1 hypothetical protein [Klebsiella michiganensis]